MKEKKKGTRQILPSSQFYSGTVTEKDISLNYPSEGRNVIYFLKISSVSIRLHKL